MFAILGEDEADTQSIKHIIRRLANDARLPIRTHGFGGCGDLIRRGSRFMKLLSGQGCEKFVIAYDADGPDPTARYNRVKVEIVGKSGVKSPFVILIPTQEFEAWIIADNAAMSVVIPSWEGKETPPPETIPSPKEYLQKLTRGTNKKPRYDPVNHNPLIAKALNLERVADKCPSFRPLKDFICG